MKAVSATKLRTQSKRLIEALKRGDEVFLLHRSKIVGKIKPESKEAKVFDPYLVGEIVEKLNLPKLNYKKRKERYHQYLIKRHGSRISRHKLPD